MSAIKERGSDLAMKWSDLRFPTNAAQSPDEWARLATIALRCNKETDSTTTARLESEGASKVINYLTEMAAMFRNVDDIENARRITERLFALANPIAGTYPRQPAHLALCLAYVQGYKKAWRVEDMPSFETHMELAIASARTAFDVYSNSERAQQLVYSRLMPDFGVVVSDRPTELLVSLIRWLCTA